MKILICDPEPGGHHLRYVQSIGAAAVRRGHQPVFATIADARRHPAWAEMRAALSESQMPEVALDDPLIAGLPRFSMTQLILRQFLMWRSFRQCVARLPKADRPDFAFAAYFDDLELTTAAFGSPFGNLPWGGIVMRQRFHHNAVNPATPPVRFPGLRRYAFERIQRIPTLKTMVTIDETLAEYYRAHSAAAPKTRFIPEPAGLTFILSKEEARRRLGVPSEGTYILLYGHVHVRKGLAELVQAVSALPPELNAGLLILGQQDDVSRACIAEHGAPLRASHRIFEFDRFASTTDESLAFSAADIVWVGYASHHGPSSVQGKAATAGRPILASQEGNLGWTTARYRTGLVINVHHPAATLAALRELVTGGPALWAQYDAACQAYASGRGEDDFGENIVHAIEDSLAK